MIKNRIGLDLRWNPKAWRQYTSLIYNDKKYVKKVNRLIKSIHRDGPVIEKALVNQNH